MVCKKNLAAASFGAALASMYAAPHLEADIVAINLSQTSVAEGVLGTFVSATNVGAGFSAWNGGTNAITQVAATLGGFTGGLAVVSNGVTLTSGFSGIPDGFFTNVPTSSVARLLSGSGILETLVGSR